jgi:TolA-binding protein
VTSLWQTPAAVIALVAWLTAPATNLADIARKEALRRQLTERSVGSFTNQDLPPVTETAPVSVPAAETPAPPPAAAPAAVEAPAKPDPKTTEEYWRKRIADARSSLERNQVLADAMQSRINGLNTDVVNIDDPFQQGQLRNQLTRALTELDRLNKQIAADTQSIKDIQTEARKQRIPPGWVR